MPLTIYTVYLKYVHKYFDPLRLNYGMEMKRSTKKIRRQKAEIKARHFKNVS